MDAIYLTALGVTLFVELPIVGWGFRRRGRLSSVLLVALLTNLAVHGVFWLSWPLLGLPATLRLLLLELLVVLVEAALYRLFVGANIKKCVQVSALANVSSTVVGLVVWEIV